MIGDGFGPENPAFLQLFDPDPDRASAKYLELFKRLVKFFEWRNCQPADELAQETLKRGFKDLDAGKAVFASDPGQFFIGYARNIARETWKVRRLDPLTDIAEPVGSTDTADQIESRLLLTQCLAKLAAVERDLVRRYYSGESDQLCAELNVNPGALRVRVYRIVEKLRRVARMPPGSM